MVLYGTENLVNVELFEYSQFIIILKKGKSHVFDFIVILLKAAIRGSVHCGRWVQPGLQAVCEIVTINECIFSCSWTRIVQCFRVSEHELVSNAFH